MQLRKRDLQQFINRELAQGRHLEQALRGRWQSVYRHPEREVRKLRRRHRYALAATNPHARVAWMRTLGAHLFRELRATSPRWQPPGKVFFVTLLDKHDQDPRDEAFPLLGRRELLQGVVEHYQGYLSGFDFVGMIDVAPYVSARVLGDTHVYFLHLHALVWGTSEQRLQARIELLRKRVRSLVPYTTSAKATPVNPPDLRQVYWYMTKSPRKQYQIWLAATGRYHQAKRGINGVNAVRVHRWMNCYTLDQLTVAGGSGEWVVAAATRDVRRRQAVS